MDSFKNDALQVTPDDFHGDLNDSSSSNHIYDVLVVGGGPGGSSCAYWLAVAGWDVALIEKKQFPRVKTCGDGLTPRSVRQLRDMGLEDSLTGAHKFVGLRSYGFGQMIEMPWPDHPAFPNYGYTITRHDLDGIVCNHAAKAGATVLQGIEAVSPLLFDQVHTSDASTLPECQGFVVRDTKTKEMREIRARYFVIADGANSRIGRVLGTQRRRDLPMGMALRGYYESDRHDEPFIESHLDIRDANGQVVPGYGWIFPLGDGRVNVGVGLLSTDKRWKGVNTSLLMDHFVRCAPKSWGLSPKSSCGPPTGGKLPMGLSVGPRNGKNVLVIGDAAGSINPFNGEGIAYGYETGRLGASAIANALSGNGPYALDQYAKDLENAYGSYYRVARAFIKLISNPTAMKLCVGVGMHSDLVMNQLLRIMANLMRPDALGPAEVAYRTMNKVSQML